MSFDILQRNIVWLELCGVGKHHHIRATTILYKAETKMVLSKFSSKQYICKIFSLYDKLPCTYEDGRYCIETRCLLSKALDLTSSVISLTLLINFTDSGDNSFIHQFVSQKTGTSKRNQILGKTCLGFIEMFCCSSRAAIEIPVALRNSICLSWKWLWRIFCLMFPEDFDGDVNTGTDFAKQISLADCKRLKYAILQSNRVD